MLELGALLRPLAYVVTSSNTALTEVNMDLSSTESCAVTHMHALHACNCGPHFVPLLTAPSGFVHGFHLWTFPEQWTLLSAFVIDPRFECVNQLMNT